MKQPKTELRVQAHDYLNLFDFLVCERGPNGERFAVQNAEFERLEEHEIAEPSFSLEKHEAQELFQNLWDLGLRPRANAHESRELKAKQETIEILCEMLNQMIKKIPDSSPVPALPTSPWTSDPYKPYKPYEPYKPYGPVFYGTDSTATKTSTGDSTRGD